MNKTLSKAVLTIVFSLASLSATAEYTFTLLDMLGGTTNDARGINDLGQVVGVSNFGNNSATIWNGTAATGIGKGLAAAINNSGLVVGQTETSNNNYRATLWTNGIATDLGTLGGPNSEAAAINNAGQIVGTSYTNSLYFHATVWNGTLATDLGTLGGTTSRGNDINSSGQVAGTSTTTDNLIRATFWNGGVATDLGTLGGNSSLGNAINDSGQVVGYAQTAAGNYHATLWNGTVATDLGTLGGGYSYASDINASGQIVGWSYVTSSADKHATLWQNGTVKDLNSLIDPSILNDGWVLHYANSINNSGQIVGNAYNFGLGVYAQAFVLTPVPEADTSAMLLIGLGVVGLMARRHKNTQA